MVMDGLPSEDISFQLVRSMVLLVVLNNSIHSSSDEFFVPPQATSLIKMVIGGTAVPVGVRVKVGVAVEVRVAVEVAIEVLVGVDVKVTVDVAVGVLVGGAMIQVPESVILSNRQVPAVVVVLALYPYKRILN